MRLLLLYILCGHFSVSCMAQQKDTSKYHRLLVIPFNPEMYLSDADRDIQMHTRKTPDEYRSYFRRSLDLKISGSVEVMIPSVSLLHDTSRTAAEDLSFYYYQSGYKYSRPFSLKKKLAVHKTADSEKEEIHVARRHAVSGADREFMNAEVTDTARVNAMARRYNADLILSVNQFEIRTNYASCLDISKGIYQRELHIHYSLIEPGGKLLQGNIAIAYFPSNTNRPEDISETAFRDVAEYLKSQIRSFL